MSDKLETLNQEIEKTEKNNKSIQRKSQSIAAGGNENDFLPILFKFILQSCEQPLRCSVPETQIVPSWQNNPHRTAE